jgi:hypothetical protein
MTLELRTSVYPRDDYVDALQKMLNRMAVSEHKYGPLETNYPSPKHALDTLVERVRLYEETGNTEWLLDAANMAVIEFLFPSHEASHFRPTDSDESPGLRER